MDVKDFCLDSFEQQGHSSFLMCCLSLAQAFALFYQINEPCRVTGNKQHLKSFICLCEFSIHRPPHSAKPLAFMECSLKTRGGLTYFCCLFFTLISYCKGFSHLVNAFLCSFYCLKNLRVFLECTW